MKVLTRKDLISDKEFLLLIKKAIERNRRALEILAGRDAEEYK